MPALLDGGVIRSVDAYGISELLLAQRCTLKPERLDALAQRLLKDLVHTAKSKDPCIFDNGIYTVGRYTIYEDKRLTFWGM